MLDAAGWKTGPDGIRIKDGRRLRLEYATTTGSVLANRIAVLLQAQWRNVGVQLDIKSYASAMYFAGYASGGILQTGRFDVEASSWLNGIDPDDSTLFTCAAVPPNGQNAFRFCDPQLDAQERIALGTFDQAVRKRAYARIQEILVDQVPQITTWFQRRFDVVNVDLRNYRPSHVITTFWNTWEYSI
jgi:peptide/nickel transport system substrate-binding protein